MAFDQSMGVQGVDIAQQKPAQDPRHLGIPRIGVDLFDAQFIADTPEGVSVQLSFFDGPVTGNDYDDYQLPSVDAQSDALPNTGPNVLPAVVLASIFLFVGAAIGIKGRRNFGNL